MKINRFEKRFSLSFFWILVLLFISILFNIYHISKNGFFSKAKNKLLKANVIRVIDGDTLDIEGGERIRLYEINSPEYPKGCLGIDAKSRLEDLVLNKIISVERIGKDNFGRTLAYLYVSNLSVNELMLEEGLAVYFKGVTMTKSSLILEQIQDKAKLAGRGVWSSYCETKKEGCIIKGNYREASNSRIYHTPDCFNYDKITIKPGTSDRWFCTEDEAEEAGFRKSKDCP